MRKVRVGLLIDDFDVPSWIYRMVEQINTSDYAEIVLVVKRESNAIQKKSFLSWLRQKFTNTFYKIYVHGENFLSKPSPDAFLNMSFKPLVESVDLLEVKCIEKKFSDYLADNDIAKIEKYDIDVFIRLGFRILRGKILKAAKLGIWSYHHGDNFVYRGGPAGFWEVFKQEREVGSILQILTEDMDGGEVLYRSWSSVEYKYNRTLNNFFWKTSLFIPRKLKQLYEAGSESFLERIRAENSGLSFYSGKNYKMPANIQFLRLWIPKAWAGFRKKLSRLYSFEQWILLYSFTGADDVSKSMYRYKRILPPTDRFWADPFVVYKDGKHYIFFEEGIWKGKTEKGHLSVMEIEKNGKISDPVVILEKPYHLSYPFIFEKDGVYYMIPESEQDKSIQLYECKNFPYEWEFKMNLMENIHAVDTTILFRDNKVWLFTNIREVEGASFSEELFLFYSDSLLTQNWKPHPLNPIVSDVKSARPAGKLFFHNEKLYRPSQDCSYRYGYAMLLNEIVELDENSYKEVKRSEITPGWANDVLATHTLSFDEGLSMIDAVIRRRKKWLSFGRKKE